MTSAVVFDLFGTLVPGGTSSQRAKVSRTMAADLSVDPAQFLAAFEDTFDARTRGFLGDLASTLGVVAEQLGARPSVEAIARAAARRLGLTRTLHQATWALPVLDDLRRAGLSLAVVSDCSPDTPAVWPGSALSERFDAVSFSCVVGVRKPDPRIYRVVLDQLQLRAENCIYVGDGGSQELSGASKLGMRAVWFDNASGPSTARFNAETGWTGERITDLRQIIDLL